MALSLARLRGRIIPYHCYFALLRCLPTVPRIDLDDPQGTDPAQGSHLLSRLLSPLLKTAQVCPAAAGGRRAGPAPRDSCAIVGRAAGPAKVGGDQRGTFSGKGGTATLHDVHTHCYSPAYLALLEEAARGVRIDRGAAGHPRLVWHGVPTVTLHPATYDPWARLHDPRQRGVARHVVSTTVPNVYPFAPHLQGRAARLVNDDLARWRDAEPQQLRGLASIPVDSDDALAEVDRALDALALSGFVMGTHLGSSELDDPRFAPIFRRLNERAARVLLHPMLPAAGPGHLRDHDLVSLVGFVADTTEVVARLWFGGFFAQYPRIRFILPQAGGSTLWLLGRWRFGWPASAGPARPLPPNLFFDTLVFSPEAVAFAAKAVGADHLLFGSDYPHLGNAEAVWRDVTDANLGHDATEAIGWRNAAALFAD